MAFDFNEQFEKMMREYDVTDVVLLGHMNPDGEGQYGRFKATGRCEK